jgi:uncharacterized protein (DUF433 family)
MWSNATLRPLNFQVSRLSPLPPSRLPLRFFHYHKLSRLRWPAAICPERPRAPVLCLNPPRPPRPPREPFSLFPLTFYANLTRMNSCELITVNPEILGGTPVFKGTRVPVRTLFEYLERGYSLEEFVECFPSVTKEMARRMLERSEAALLAA